VHLFTSGQATRRQQDNNIFRFQQTILRIKFVGTVRRNNKGLPVEANHNGRPRWLFTISIGTCCHSRRSLTITRPDKNGRHL